MNLKRIPLGRKILYLQGITMFVILAVIIAFVYTKSSNITEHLSYNNIRNTAKYEGSKINDFFNNALFTARSLSSTMLSLKESTAQREIISTTLKQTLLGNKKLMGAWTIWEPDVFDSKDSEYIGQKGHDKTGRVVYYWNTVGGIHVEPCVDYEAADSYYERPKKSMKEIVMEPFVYKIGGKDVMVVSVISPIIKNGVFLGIVGVDFSMDEIKSQVLAIKLYEKGTAFFIAGNGDIVSHIKPEYIGKNITEIENGRWSALQKDIKDGKEITYTRFNEKGGFDEYVNHVPLKMGNSGTFWSLAVTAPTEDILKEPKEIRFYSIIIGTLGFGLLLLITFLLLKLFINPINDLKNMMREAAQGEADMTQRLHIDSEDELGDLAKWFNKFVERIQDLIVKVKQNSNSVSSASLEISSSTEELASTVEEQSAQSQSVSSALHQLSATSADIAASMEEARTVTENSSKLTREGSKVIESSIESLKMIQAQSDNLGSIVSELGDSTQQIGSIVDVINEVADQTNLLALNAAIEAARAGEHGRGFAVVADEVRKLAERTARATSEIVNIINALVQKSEAAAGAMGKTSKEIINGRKLGEESLNILNQIVVTGEEVSKSAESVATAIEEENVTIDEISGNVQGIAAGSQESASAVAEVAQTADDLAKEADTLKNLVEQFITE